MKKVKKFVFPGLGLIASIYASIAFAAGAVIGFFATEIFIKKFLKTGKIKEVKIRYGGWEFHMHHWIMASAIIGGAYFTHDLNSFPTIALGVLNGLIFHDIYTHNKWKKDDKKWYQFLYKKPLA